MTVTIIGLGLIGGSLALDMRRLGLANHILGVDANDIHANRALELGLVDEITDIETGVERAELIAVAISVDATVRILPFIMDMTENQIVFDVGSTKKPVIDVLKGHKKRMNFVAAHPMAGTEYSGPEAALERLFENKALIICNREDSSSRALDVVESVFEALGMNILSMDSAEHDMHAAYVSHISHISSFALALTVLHKEKDEKSIFNLASGGFESTVRLAKSSPDMWSPIFLQNKRNILEVLDTYINFLYDFKLAIFNNDAERLHYLMRKGNSIKEVLGKQEKREPELVQQ